MSDDTADPERLREAFQESTGHWRPAYDDWLALDRDGFALFAAFAAHPWEGDALTEREKALVQVALDAAVTSRNEAGLRTAVGHALDAGATVGEVREVLELTCGLGMHTVIEALPAVRDATDDADHEPDVEEQRRVRERFEEKRGYWSPFWDSVLDADHEYLDRYTDLSAHPWETGTLDPKLREFVYVAIDASTTHLYAPGLSAHVENAVDYGATGAELVELLELVSLQGYDAMATGMPVLREEANRRDLLE